MFEYHDLVPARRKKTGRGAIIAGIILGLVAGFGASKAIHYYWIFPFVTGNNDMSPTYPEGSTVYINRRTGLSKIVPGDVVLAIHPSNEEYSLLRRVAALPGDRIEILNRRIAINGKYISGELKKKLEAGALPVGLIPNEYSPRDSMKEITVPPGHIFLLADNKLTGLDSRQLGPFPDENLIGVAE